MIWHIITRLGEADAFEPVLSIREPRVYVGLGRTGDPHSLGPDALKTLAKGAGRLPESMAIDLLTIASAVFAADLRVARDLAPDRWTRAFRLYVPVTDPSRWSVVADLLVRLLTFLTGDSWEITFRALTATPHPEFGNSTPRASTVCLFSGGLDSLVGGIDLLSTGESIALVGHHGAGLTNGVQKRVLAPLRDRFIGAMQEFMFYVQPSKLRSAGEQSMRSRSFLFLALGTAVASALHAPRLVVAENGLISLNVPLTLARLGSHSTRTTHPHVMAMFSELLSALGLEIGLDLPYRFQTKGEMLAAVADQGLLAELAPLTMSCSHPEVGRYLGTTPGNHCGYCVPCVIRRASLKRASLSYDAYDVDVLIQPPPRSSRTSDDIRAFAMAIERLKGTSHRQRAADVVSTGPISAAEITPYTEMYARGMSEVASFLADVPRL